jgi:hypothetical protein
LLFPQPQKRGTPHPADPRNRLVDSDEVRRSAEQDWALWVEAKRQQAQNAAEKGRIENERRRFELTRDEVIFGFEIFVTCVCLVMFCVLAATKPEPLALVLFGGGGLGGAGLIFRRREGG